MFTHFDLDALVADTSHPAVSLYMPTHRLGSEIREGPIRLRGLLEVARADLLSRPGGGDLRATVDALLAPALALIDDYPFWQHQDQGLALFLGAGGLHTYRVPLDLPERVMVGRGFRVRPLLPLLASDGQFLVCTLTEDRVLVFRASKFGMSEVVVPGVPKGAHSDLGSVTDYENPVQASPVARPNTGSINISNAQVYGDSPPEWRKTRVLEYIRKTALAIDQFVRAAPAPVVVVASPEIAGHFRKFSELNQLLVATLTSNPAASDPSGLHEMAFEAVRPFLESARNEAVSRFAALRGQRDPRAVTETQQIIAMSRDARIESLFLVAEPPAREQKDPPSDAAETMLESVIAQTLRQGGAVHLVPAADLPGVVAAATLRY